MNNKTKICPNCGGKIPLSAEKCKYCANWVDDEYRLSNHKKYNYVIEDISQEKVESSKEQDLLTTETIEESKSNIFSNVLPIRRFFLLMFFTLGLYEYYWYYKNSDLISKDKNPLVRTILFIIPIVNWFAYYSLLNDINTKLKKNNLQTFSVAWNVLFYIFSPILGFWSLINVQEHVNEYWRIENPEYQTRLNFTDSEKVIMAIIPLIMILFILYITIFISLLN
ncbi:hypothetical protein LJC03_05490 [Methanobrevibacter sp. OttesenSCG-928-I08]|nr:hypothetical protein [Methanobrevibacter sp. OttesenSCG-928-I08]